jgi:hypothetical protein
MMTAYFDEASGKDFTVVGGWVASVEDWDNFEVDWKLFLINYKVPYFHMKEISQFKGPFKKFENVPNFRARFLQDAWDVIKFRVKRGFVCGIQHVLFNRINRSYQLEESFASCYALAGREAMDWANRYSHIAARDEVKCIFEDGGPNKGGLIKAADVEPTVSRPVFEPSRDIQDRKKGKRRGLVQIQAADFLAYEVRKFWVDHPLYRSGERKPRESLRLFGDKRPDTKLMSEERIFATCQRYSIPPRNKNG